MNQNNNIYDNLPTVLVDDNNLVKIETFSIRRSLVFIAFIDFIFEMINGFSYAFDNDDKTLPLSYTSFICSAIILVGICGINRYHSCSSKIYGTYVVLRVASYIGLLFAFNLTFAAIVFFGFIIILNIWILKLLYRFSNNLSVLRSEDIVSLKNGWEPNIHRIVLV